jgi:hypothetical protein
MIFLTIAIGVGSAVESALADRRPGALLRECVLIGGWVAMWRPLEIFLYDWWPILGERRIHDGLSRMQVRIAPRAEPSDHPSRPTAAG